MTLRYINLLLTMTLTFTTIGVTAAEIFIAAQKERITADLISNKTHTSIAFLRLLNYSKNY